MISFQGFFRWTVKTEQTGQMPRLIWIFTERSCHYICFVMLQRIFDTVLDTVSCCTFQECLPCWMPMHSWSTSSLSWPKPSLKHSLSSQLLLPLGLYFYQWLDWLWQVKSCSENLIGFHHLNYRNSESTVVLTAHPIPLFDIKSQNLNWLSISKQHLNYCFFMQVFWL